MTMTTEYRRSATIDEAAAVLAEIVRRQDGGDANYFDSQLTRFRYSVGRIMQLRPPSCRVLDIGSHYLHQAVLLSLLGYDVVGLDVPLFTDAPFVRERADAMNVRNISSLGHQAGEFLEGCEGKFDLIICTEMLEHIAFNPVAFWRRVWQLLADGGMIYVTTPNSFRMRALLKAFYRLVTFKGLGLPIDEVLTVITYGHHWKEYSAREIREYFHRLSPDFTVETSTYPDADSKNSALSRSFEIFPPFRSNIEAIVRLRSKTRFMAPPVLPMMAKSH
jgi:2-polyprenyl-3-methyl-5-hydroxy-6-metoxy-1,4-benzoquinol methylase